MQTIGERLEEARKRKGISIREASEATKIRSDYLQKFESNTFEINLPDIYVRGFLRTYAHYLKLNTDKLLTDFTALGFGGSRDRNRHEARESFGRIDLPEPAKAAVAAEAPPVREAPVAPNNPRATSARTTAAIAAGGADNERGYYLKLGLLAGGAVLALVLLFLIVRLLMAPSSHERPSTAAAPVAPTASVPATGDLLTLVALDNVRVKVKQGSDGKILFDGDLVRGDTRALTRQGRVVITYDVGRNLQVEIRGQRYNMTDAGYGRNSLD
jgi:transcriptional regulator with XRE-family HTH domain